LKVIFNNLYIICNITKNFVSIVEYNLL
jgi:hypothetical protein